MKQSIKVIHILSTLMFLLGPNIAFGITENDKHAVLYDTPFFDSSDGGATSCTQNGPATVDGHTLPAATGPTGFEDPLTADGHVMLGSDPSKIGGSVAFSDVAKTLPQNSRDYYINMRWRYALWNWDGTTTKGPEDFDFYHKNPKILVTNPRNGKSIILDILDAGPGPSVGAIGGPAQNGWTNPQDGTPASYTGLVSGMPPKAYTYLEAVPGYGHNGDKLIYSWATDQNASPGPVTVNGGAVAPSSATSSTCSGGLGVGANGFVFPEKTTQAAITSHSPKWCYDSSTSCHHDYVAADIFNDEGTQVVAAVAGTVLTGNPRGTTCSISDKLNVPRVQILGDDGKYYYYTHMKPGSLVIHENQHLNAGDPIGVIGPKECAEGTDTHLHFQVSSVPINNTEDPTERAQYIDPQPALIQAFKNLPAQ